MTVLNDQQGDQHSAAQTAKDEASGVAGHAKSAAGDVARTSTEQAKEVAGEAKRQARDLAGEARSRVTSQASDQRQKAVTSIRSIGDELGQMADRSESSGLAAELARQASTRAHDFAGLLENKEPGDLLEDVRAFARRRPGAFLLGAAVAGVAVGRLTRGVVATHRDDSDSGQDWSGSRPSPSTLSSDTGYESGYGTADLGAGAGYAAGTTDSSSIDYGTTTAGGDEFGTDTGYSSGTTSYDPDQSGLDPLASPTTGVTAAGGSRPVEGGFSDSDDPLVDEPRRDLP